MDANSGFNWGTLPNDFDGFMIDDDFLKKSMVYFPLGRHNNVYSDTEESDKEESYNDGKQATDKYTGPHPKQAAQKTLPKYDLTTLHGGVGAIKRDVPGKLAMLKADFPSFSDISSQEQATYIELCNKYPQSRLPFLSRKEQEELRMYSELTRRVQHEQKEYIQFAHKNAELNVINYELFNETCRHYIESALHFQQRTIPQLYYPLYCHYEDLPLSWPTKNHPVVMEPLQHLRSLGEVPYFTMPNFENRVSLPRRRGILEQHFPSDDDQLSYPSSSYGSDPGKKILKNNLVSMDHNAASLAVTCGANIVTSSSVMETLVDCHPNHVQNCAPPRDIPVIVKMLTAPDGSQHKVVFLDKALPPTSMSVYEKKMWYCRRAVKIILCQSSERIYNFAMNKEVFADPCNSQMPAYCEKMTFEEELQLYQKEQDIRLGKARNDQESTGILDLTKNEEVPESPKTKSKFVSDQSPKKKCLAKEVPKVTDNPTRRMTRSEYKKLLQSKEEKISDKKLVEAQKVKVENKEEVNTQELKEDMKGVKPSIKEEIAERKHKFENKAETYASESTKHNVVYNLWSLRRREAERLADIKEKSSSELKLLIRANYHGYNYEQTEAKYFTMVHTSVKLEHQPQYGAQTATVGELSREWMALLLRPQAMLQRVRVDAANLDIIQVQPLSLREVLEEGRNRNLNASHCLGAVHHLLVMLAKQEPGQYLLRLKPIDSMGQLLKQKTSYTVSRGGLQLYNLHNDYQHSSSVEGPASKVPYSPIDSNISTPYHRKHQRIPATFRPRDIRAKTNKTKKNKQKQHKLMLKHQDLQQKPQDLSLEMNKVRANVSYRDNGLESTNKFVKQENMVEKDDGDFIKQQAIKQEKVKAVIKEEKLGVADNFMTREKLEACEIKTEANEVFIKQEVDDGYLPSEDDYLVIADDDDFLTE